MLRAIGGVRRLFVSVLRHEGDVVKSAGTFADKERAQENYYIHHKEHETAEKALKHMEKTASEQPNKDANQSKAQKCIK